jgi:hypothetical protein
LLPVWIALASGAAHAETLQPIEGRSIDLGPVAGTAYYTVDKAGFRVVATLAQGENGTPVRIVGILAPGQSLTLGAAGSADTAGRSVAIRRQGDQVLVDTAPVTY